MRIIRNEDAGIWILVPDGKTPNERGYMISLVTYGIPDRPLLYLGRTEDGFGARFRVGPVTIELHGATRIDREIINEMCRICRAPEGATGELTFVEQRSGGVVVVTGVRCAGCNKYMIDFESCKKRKCASCRAKVPAAVH